MRRSIWISDLKPFNNQSDLTKKNVFFQASLFSRRSEIWGEGPRRQKNAFCSVACPSHKGPNLEN